jgi:hypothetical protein
MKRIKCGDLVRPFCVSSMGKKKDVSNRSNKVPALILAGAR